MKKPTTEELKKEIARREWRRDTKQFRKMLGRFFKRAGEKVSMFSFGQGERFPEFPQYFHPTEITAVSGVGMGGSFPAMQGESFCAAHDGGMSYWPKYSQCLASDWQEITKAEFEAAWKTFCASVAAAR